MRQTLLIRVPKIVSENQISKEKRFRLIWVFFLIAYDKLRDTAGNVSNGVKRRK